MGVFSGSWNLEVFTLTFSIIQRAVLYPGQTAEKLSAKPALDSRCVKSLTSFPKHLVLGQTGILWRRDKMMWRQYTESSYVTVEAETWVMHYKPRNIWCYLRPKKGRKDSSKKLLRGDGLANTSISDTEPPELRERLSEPQSLPNLVTATIGN